MHLLYALSTVVDLVPRNTNLNHIEHIRKVSSR